ncbi:MAG: flagellar basal-body MS-ring/collar protein FliF [Betaproteobacteria bacterium]
MDLTQTSSPATAARPGMAGLTQLQQHPLFRQLLVMVSIAASVALGVAVVLWSQSPSYSLLYGNLGEGGAQEVRDALQKAGVDYRVDEATGGLLVPSRKLHDVRMTLAAQGLPRSDGLGFEMLQKDSALGTSRLVEQARHHRAMEGELARTIGTLSAVESARVHLAIPKQSVFVRKRVPPSASVVLRLHAGRSLDRSQVEAVVHLVASSVPELEADNVTVVDQRGKLLNAEQRDGELKLTATQFEYTRQLEDHYRQRVETLLEPIVGAGAVRAQVSADVDFTRTEQTEERFNPERPVLRSEQLSEDQNRLAAVQGVPGALSNQPPPSASVPEKAAAPAAAPDAAAPPASVSRQSTRNFEIDKTVSHTRQAPARLRRLSVAVVVDNVLEPATEDAEPVRRERTAEEMERMATLVREAVGFNEQRGDSVRVVNAAFLPAEDVAVPEPGFWQQAWFWDVLRQVGGLALVALLVLGVLRPAFKRLVAQAQQPAGAPPGVGAGRALPPGAAGQLPNGAVAAALEGGHEPMRLPGPGRYEDVLDAARNLVRDDPKRVAQLVKTWVGENG